MKKIIILSVALLLMNLIAQGQEQYAVEKNEVMMAGYDPISFFAGQPEKGNEVYQVKFDDRIIYFSREENKNKFLTAPNEYLPEYGGWCAYSMSRNTFVFPDYTVYKIQEGKLFFFAVKAFFNGKTAWEKNPEASKIIADKNYHSYYPK